MGDVVEDVVDMVPQDRKDHDHDYGKQNDDDGVFDH